MKPPKMNGKSRAVYDKTTGPVYFSKGGKIYKKGYADGGDVLADSDIANLTPDQKVQYYALKTPSEKAQFLDNISGTLSKSANISKGIIGAIPSAGQFASNLVDNNLNDNNITQKSVLSDSIKRAGQGAGIGTSIAPGIGTAIGAGIGALAGGVEGFIGGRKKEKQINDENVAKQKANALAEKEKRDIAAKANMNPWEVGYGMADGGEVTSTESELKNMTKKGTKQLATFYGQRNYMDPKTGEVSLKYYKVQAPYSSKEEYNALNKQALNEPGGFQGATIDVPEEEFMNVSKKNPNIILYGKGAGSFPTTKEKPFYTNDDLKSLTAQSNTFKKGGEVSSAKAKEILYKENSEYEVSDSELNRLKNLGYKIDVL